MNAKKISSAIFITITALLALIIVIPALPIDGNYKIMAVLSGSMEPKIKTGGIVIVKPEASYQIGDVISFSTANARKVSTSHRIIEINTDGSNTFYTTKGDANNAQDVNPVNKRNVIGKVIFTLPYAGYAMAFVRQPMGFLAAVIVPSSLIVFDEAQNIWRELYGGRSRYKIAQKIKISAKPRIPKVYRIKVKEIL